MIQQNLVKLNVENVYPQKAGTFHAGGFCKCDDGLDYAFKQVAPGAEFVPATEWLCGHLSNTCRIHTPPMEILHGLDGRMWFGSRIEGGTLDADQCVMELASGEMDKRILNLRERLSAIYAFDMFVNNSDRHLKNLLFRTSLEGVVMLAFDYSLAWLAHGAALDLYLTPESKTRQVRSFLDTLYGFDLASAEKVLNAIQGLPADWIDGPVGAMPGEWQHGVDVATAVAWWKSDARAIRCETIKGALK
ncbi:MAG TPA: hypothetical protein DHU88_03305 [Pseudomonas sp.]|nr:hypothetical protein [Pseudomonas sp.]